MKRADAVRSAAPLLFTAEESIHTALRDLAAMTVGLIDHRREAGLSPVVGSAVLAQIAGTHAALHQGCVGITAVHASLADVKVQMGCRTVDSGGLEKYPEDHPRFTDDGTPFLQVVREAA